MSTRTSKPIPNNMDAFINAEPAKPKRKKPSGPNAGRVAPGHVRLVADIPVDTHTRLKVEAVKRRITVKALLQELIEKHTPKL